MPVPVPKQEQEWVLGSEQQPVRQLGLEPELGLPGRQVKQESTRRTVLPAWAPCFQLGCKTTMTMTTHTRVQLVTEGRGACGQSDASLRRNQLRERP